MIRRNIADKLESLSRTFPVVTVTGPRQSGKTTLCRQVFPDHEYLSMERPDLREYATSDPLDLLERHGDAVIFDEIQRVPELLSYLQTEVDHHRRPGRFVLTGSHNFLLLSGVSQTLAGRTAVLNLLPFSRDEVERFANHPETVEASVWSGSYPPILDEGHEPADWLSAYVDTYVERDVRQVMQIKDLRSFQLFLRLCAARTGRVLNMSSLAADAGVSAVTVRSWLGVLEASFLINLVPGWYANSRKRLIKSPKLHFVDTGLCCWLLGIRSPSDLALHHARGAIFESWVASELLKSRLNRGLPPALFHVRTQKGEEVDLLVDDGPSKRLVEVKSGKTIAGDAFRGLSRGEALTGLDAQRWSISRSLVYGGAEARRRGDVDLIPWLKVARADW